jgi:hypothetical protein
MSPCTFLSANHLLQQQRNRKQIYCPTAQTSKPKIQPLYMYRRTFKEEKIKYHKETIAVRKARK